MEGMWNLSVSHAKLAVGLLESKCWHALCVPDYASAEGDTRPEWRDGELVSFAREVGSRFVRGQMLSRFVRRAISEWRRW